MTLEILSFVPSDLKRYVAMKHRVMLPITVLASTICVAVAACWIASTRAQVNVVWTTGTTHNQLISYNSSLYLVRNFNWWRKESLAIQIDPYPGIVPIERWPGMNVDSQHDTCGIMRITGKWVSPFVQVTEDTEFTSPDISIEPGTMYYSTTPMSIWSAQYWLLMVLPVSWLLGRIAFRFHASRHQRSHSETENVLVTAT